MATTYSAKFTIKTDGKTRNFTINNVDPQIYNKVADEEDTEVMKAVTTFGVAYASAYESTGTLSKATVVKTQDVQIY